MGLHCDSACGLQIGSPDVSVLTQDRCDSPSPHPNTCSAVLSYWRPLVPYSLGYEFESSGLTLSSQSTAQDKRSGSG